jgi:hypothetical protein
MMNMKRWLILWLFFSVAYVSLKAQHQDLQEKPKIWNGDRPAGKDSLSILSAFRNGKVNGHFRYFYSATDNTDDLTDYYAHAAGGGLRFETAEFHRLRFAVSGFYVFNLASSDLGARDPLSGAVNRYEIGLFDIANPSNKGEISRLEEFYLKYRVGKKNYITFGKQLINTPFINLQDGRMRPTQVQGLWSEWHSVPKTDIYAGWLYSIAPRGTSVWYRLEESIGVYPAGINPDGSKSGYKGNVHSKGAALLGLRYKLKENIGFQFWNLFTENIFNSILLQSDASFHLNDQLDIITGLQAIRQDKTGNGGSENVNEAYFNNDKGAFTFGARLGLKSSVNEWTVNFNRITKEGRYLMPREWGRDPFYTFMPRERNEGYGDLTALTIQYKWADPKKPWQIGLAGGYFDMPDIRNTKLNKYAMSSYSQINIDLRYRFSEFLEGTEAQLLVVRKIAADDHFENPAHVINKVDMTLINAVINFRF